ncbi:hypothetical protein SH668x_002199 [Planctomicrobium sp. SH668]|uniref:hypothetical protein n=1 Tax=Planctomicrobium sp. SH668 TaxID=3448126 RepID=UPI003F5AEFC8
MSDNTPFEIVEQVMSAEGGQATLTKLCDILQEKREWHNLFDARMLHAKSNLGLSLARPTSLQDVPETHRKAMEEVYLAAAREAGTGFLEDGDIPNAWMYFKVIRDHAPVAAALEKLPNSGQEYGEMDRMIQIALYEGVNPLKGIKMLLKGHGVCNTITALDQVLPQLEPAQRLECAKLMVRTIYEELTASVRRHVEERIPMLPPNLPLDKLIAGRDWLTEGGSYHIDVSHLSSTVRFAHSIEAPAPELEMALHLAQYGSRLEPSLQYGGEPPFNDMYPAHIHFFNVLLDKNRDAGLKYFRDQLDAEPDEQDKPIYAYVLVDLLIRCGKLDEAVEIAERYLKNVGEEVNVSFDELCVNAGRLDILQRVRKEEGNLVGFVAALVRSKK